MALVTNLRQLHCSCCCCISDFCF